MSRAFSFIGIIIVMAVGMFIYSRQLKSVSPSGMEGSTANPRATIDLQGVRRDLIQFAKVEQQHLATDGHYISLDDMRSAGDTGLPADSRANFNYSVDVGSNTFTVTATYAGPPIDGVPKVMKIGPEMSISTE